MSAPSPVTVSVKVTAEFKPFMVPTFARISSEGDSANGHKVCDLDQEALDALAWRWLCDLYGKACKPIPFRKMAFRQHDARGAG